MRDANADERIPITLIWGRHDGATPLAVAEAASVRFAWPLHVVENCNDDRPVEQPEARLRAPHRHPQLIIMSEQAMSQNELMCEEMSDEPNSEQIVEGSDRRETQV